MPKQTITLFSSQWQLKNIAHGVAHWNERMHFYTNVATVFETPTTTELTKDPSGGSGFNPDLNSQKSMSYEIGLKSIKTEETEFNLALFFIQSRDELIPFELDASPGSTFYKNAGKSLRIGLEAMTVCRPMKGIKTFVSYYIYSDFKFTEFNDDGVDQLGHFIPSIPEHHFTVILDAYSQSKWFARGEIEYGSAFFVNNENTIKNDAYTQASSRLGGKALWEYFGGLFFLV